MGKKLYGSLNNRFSEGKNYNEDKLIHEGDDITMYYWSDRHCYYVTRVIDQKHIFVKQYHVCADHSKPGGMGHQNWMYFKTRKEEAEYLKKFFPETETNVHEPGEEEWVFKYGRWKSVTRWTKEKIEEAQRTMCLWFNDKEQEKLDAGKEVWHYNNLEPISFGTLSYYRDWEF